MYRVVTKRIMPSGNGYVINNYVFETIEGLKRFINSMTFTKANMVDVMRITRDIEVTTFEENQKRLEAEKAYKRPYRKTHATANHRRQKKGEHNEVI